MSVTLGPLKNSNLLEHRLPSEEYNALARIDDCKLEPLKHREAHSSLLNLIAGHGLSDKFSIHLVHKHFDVPQDQVMVYEKVKGGKTPDFVVMAPRDPKKVPGPLRGLYFKTTPDNKMQAYEYTTEAAVDLSVHEDFVQAYATLANGLGVGHLFALGAEGIATIDTPMAEFEMGPYSSTVLVEADSLPGLEQVDSSPTDWVPDSAAAASAKPQEKALAGSGVAGGTIYPEIQGLITTHCIAGRSGSHNYHGNSATAKAAQLAGTGQVTTHCLAGRSGNHNYHGQSATPDLAKAPLSGAGKVGGTLYPEVQGLITTHCYSSRSGKHCYHGNAAEGSGSGVFAVETRQSMAGMSNRVGQGEVEVHPGIRVGDLPVMKDSVIHDVLDRAVQAIEAY
ncbi:hypothetical protein PG991_006081 [Apiospora marii]|uniref:Uncharacterized protein n=1 Tax=Apiospora marii TaxID=335849 RepID=A0ABR1SCA7_9PEZI